MCCTCVLQLLEASKPTPAVVVSPGRLPGHVRLHVPQTAARRTIECDRGALLTRLSPPRPASGWPGEACLLRVLLLAGACREPLARRLARPSWSRPLVKLVTAAGQASHGGWSS